MSDHIIDGLKFSAKECIDGIFINPVLPLGFMSNYHTEMKLVDITLWWNRPFVQVDLGNTANDALFSELELTQIKNKFSEEWPDGMFKLYVFDGAKEVGPTLRGCFKNIDDVLTSAIAWNIAVEYDS